MALYQRNFNLVAGLLALLLIGGGLQAWSMSRGINLRLSELREVVAQCRRRPARAGAVQR